MSIVFLKTVRATQTAAAKLARQILDAGSRRRGAVVLGLVGELGAGKTTFAQGFARAFGVRERVASPTFILMRRHKLKNQPFENFYHIDVYRLCDPKELAALGLKKILDDPANIVLIEWADKVRRLLPKNTLWLKFGHGEHEGERRLITRNQEVGKYKNKILVSP